MRPLSVSAVCAALCSPVLLTAAPQPAAHQVRRGPPLPVLPHVQLGVHLRGAGEADAPAQVQVSFQFHFADTGRRRLRPLEASPTFRTKRALPNFDMRGVAWLRAAHIMSFIYSDHALAPFGPAYLSLSRLSGDSARRERLRRGDTIALCPQRPVVG